MKDNYISTIETHKIPFHLPENWRWFRWSDLMISYQQGLIRSNRELGEGNVEYLKMGDLIGDGTARFDGLTRANANSNEIDQFSLKEGDFLINVRNSKELVGKTCITQVLNSGPVLFNHMLVRIDHGSKDLNYFINAFLNIPTSKKMLDRIKQGTTTVIALYQRDLNDVPIALPDQNTFNKIVSIYKNLLHKISLNNRINAELEAMAKTIYDYWFVQFDFPDKNGKPYKASGGKMVWSEELKREIPEGWEVKKLQELGNFKNGVNYDPSNPGKVACPIINVRNISASSYFLKNEDLDIIYLNESDVRKYAVHQGSIIIARSGIPGATRLIADIADNTLYCGFAIHYELNNLDIKIPVFFYLKSIEQQIQNGSGGTILKNVNQATLNVLQIALPQDEGVILRFNELIQPVFHKLNLIQKENQKLTELRDWLLPMLMNGQIKIKDTEEELAMAAEPGVTYGKKA